METQTETIVVPNVDVKLLREQRTQLERVVDRQCETEPDLSGLLNMLDYMIDKGEGVDNGN